MKIQQDWISEHMMRAIDALETVAIEMHEMERRDEKAECYRLMKEIGALREKWSVVE